MSQNNLNDHAQNRFAQLKKKMKLNFLEKEVEQGKISPPIDENKLKRMLEGEQVEKPVYRTLDFSENEKVIDETFNFIDSLQLPSQLSLAIALIISAHKTSDKQDIAKAVIALGEYTNG